MNDRVQLAAQAFRSLTREIGLLDRVYLQEQLTKLLQVCGEQSANKKTALAILRALIKTGGEVRLIGPCCPDYSNDGRVYTFRGLGSGVSLLCRKQIGFIERLLAEGVTLKAILVYADIEAEDPLLRQMAGVTEEEFLLRVEDSVQATRDQLLADVWRVDRLSRVVPDFAGQQQIVLAELRGRQAIDASFRARITNDTILRRSLYERLGSRLKPDEQIERTLRTAAQYLVLGRHAAEAGFLICNHTTVNLSWYGEAGSGVLHNPADIY